MEFEYEPLRESTSLRLLKVSREKRHDQIQIKLWEQLEPVAYRCLSYMWGDPSPSFTIQANGRSMQIGKNLHEFLVVAAERFAEETLWIDAICINQGDAAEKGVQVQKMGKTFMKAIEVLVWLGNSERIANFLAFTQRSLSKRQRYPFNIYPHRIPKKFVAGARELGVHLYWGRAWIIQELALARRLRLLSGISETTVTALQRYNRASGSPLFSSRLRSALSCLPNNFLRPLFGTWEQNYPLFHLCMFLRDIGIDDAQSKPWDSRHEDTQSDPPRNFQLSMWSLPIRLSCCQELRDRIYSVLDIVNATDFRVDYDESDFSTFRRAAIRFSAWHIPFRLWALWIVFEFDRDAFQRAVDEESSQTTYCSIPARCARRRSHASIVSRSGSPHPGPKFGENCRSGYLEFPQVGKGDILLCSYDREIEIPGDWECVHFILRPLESGNGKSFSILANVVKFIDHNLFMIADAELWFVADGSERLILDMEDANRLTSLQSSSMDNWKAGPHFVLKLPAQYVVGAVRVYD
ncbi:hypothetical protein OPT61_g6340 [Boeremia exigua]|uniref:Uncharacterized protein n=1 Tax=Boeremia exigua TaxID=749465 RepID=A0ACC2I6Y5_9PLEO|nr:hypothetical protein OPT61_g6340 [Boeremia exigua]